MAIDGIGKFPISGASGSIGAPDDAGALSKAEFTLKSPPGTEAVSGAGSADSGLLDRVQSGQLTREQYLDIRADEAVKHLVGQVPADKLELIRATLRDQLNTDPLLIAMVRRAIGEH